MSDKRLFLLFRTRGGSASIQIFYTYITPSDDIHYDNPSYAFVVQWKSCVRWQISAPQCSKLCSCERPILQDMCISCGQGSTQLSRMLLLLPFVCENAVKAGSSFKALKLLRCILQQTSYYHWWQQRSYASHTFCRGCSLHEVTNSCKNQTQLT